MRKQICIDVTDIAGLGEAAEACGELLLPGDASPRILFACIPGGGMNRIYFDLPTPDGEAEMSFAAAMLARGHAVLLIDPLGSGMSTFPADPSLLHPDAMARANDRLVEHVLAGLRDGSLTGTAMPGIVSIGAAHSLGALQTIVQQAETQRHDALVLMGFQPTGLPEQLTEADKALDAAETRANLVAVARTRFPMTYIDPKPASGGRATHAIPALDRVLLTPSLMAMLPDMVSPDAAKITAPVLIVQGEKDLHGPPHRAPLAYPASDDITLLVLPDTRHNHFIYPTRTALFERVARWAEALL